MPERREIPFSPPDITEAEISEVVEALRSGWITTGPRTKDLERRLKSFIGSGGVACLSSATAAEELNLRLLGIGLGDEVIVPAYTYTATASAAIHCGARVVFVDIQRDGDAYSRSPEMDYDAVAHAMTEKTKAIIPVDIGGVPCDYERLFDVVNSKRALFTPIDSDNTVLGDFSSRIQHAIGRVAVVADCAHSLGAGRILGGKNCQAGAMADFSSFSFHAVKNLTTAEGGASTWRSLDGIDDSEIYRMYQLLSLHGQDKDALAKTKAGAWEYDIIGPWYKCNMTDVVAAIGLRQLDRYTQLLARRHEIIKRYDEACDSIGVIHLEHEGDTYNSSGHLYLARVPGIRERQRNRLIELMSECGISCNVHYKPLPLMTGYKDLGYDIDDYPNAYAYYENVISLPLHTRLTNEDVEYVIRCWHKCHQKVSD